MNIVRTEGAFLIAFEKDEKIIESLTKFTLEEKLGSGQILGIGAVKNTRLGYYHLSQKKYDERVFEEDAELLSLNGNISWFQDKPIIHCHLVLSDSNFSAMGGHLFEAEVAVTVEVIVTPREYQIERKFVSQIGLNLWSLPCAAPKIL